MKKEDTELFAEFEAELDEDGLIPVDEVGDSHILLQSNNACIVGTEKDDSLMIQLGGSQMLDGPHKALLGKVLDQSATIYKHITIDMPEMSHLPEGTFGLLRNKIEKHGIELFLQRPTEQVRRMIWFTLFCEQIDEDLYRLHATHQNESNGFMHAFVSAEEEELMDVGIEED